MRSESLVCTMVSSLAPRSSCRSAAMRLRSLSVTCSTAARPAAAGEVAQPQPQQRQQQRRRSAIGAAAPAHRWRVLAPVPAPPGPRPARSALQRQRAVDPVKLQPRMAQRELHAGPRQQRQQRRPQPFGAAVVQWQGAQPGQRSERDPDHRHCAEAGELAVAAVDQAQHQQVAADQQQRGVRGLRQPDLQRRAPRVLGGQQRLRADLQCRQAAGALPRRHLRQRQAGDLQLQRVGRRVEHAGRQHRQLRPVAVARDRLAHAPAAVHQLAVEPDLEVAARALDVQREQLAVGRGRCGAEPDAVPHRAAAGRIRVPLVGQRDGRAIAVLRQARRVALHRLRAIDPQRLRRQRCGTQPQRQHQPPARQPWRGRARAS
jgi:hypothetical protein